MRTLTQELFEDDDSTASNGYGETVIKDGKCFTCGDDQCQCDSPEIEAKTLDALTAEIKQLGSAALAIENFGIDQASYQILLITGLMTGTALAAIPLDKIGTESYDSANSHIAVEGLLDKAKEKAAGWSAKVLAFLSNGAKNVISVLEPIWKVISTQIANLGKLTWDMSKKATATIKAHPVKTIMAVLAAAAVVAGIVAFAGGSFPSIQAASTAMEAFMARSTTLFRSIKWPFGAVKIKMVAGGKAAVAIAETAGTVAKEQTLSALGWSASAVRAISGQITKVWSVLTGGIKQTWKIVTLPFKVVDATIENYFHVKKAGEVVGKKVLEKTGSKAAAWVAKFTAVSVYTSIIWKFFGGIFNLIKAIIVKAFKMTRDTFRAIADFLV